MPSGKSSSPGNAAASATSPAGATRSATGAAAAAVLRCLRQPAIDDDLGSNRRTRGRLAGCPRRAT
eukprot:9952816-Lingulodinium_polyedra.AAC.1